MERIITEKYSDLHEVYRTEAGSVYQSDLEKCLYLNFSRKQAKFKYSCLLRLKKAIEAVDVDRMLTHPEASDVEIISICACEHCYVLTALDILALRDLLQGAFVMFQLNHIIKDCLHRIVV